MSGKKGVADPMGYTAGAQLELCYLLKHDLIPKAEVHRVFTESYSAAAELSLDFLCFDEPYQRAACAADKDSIILDLGCAYASQGYYFLHCARYIGVDLPMTTPNSDYEYPAVPETRFCPENGEIYVMSIQKFIREVLPSLHLDRNNVIAVCSAVPDEAAQRLVAQTFPVHHISYPGEKSDITLPPPIHTLEELFERQQPPLTIEDTHDNDTELER